jgi:hypothetical protein
MNAAEQCSGRHIAEELNILWICIWKPHLAHSLLRCLRHLLRGALCLLGTAFEKGERRAAVLQAHQAICQDHGGATCHHPGLHILKVIALCQPAARTQSALYGFWDAIAASQPRIA